MERVAVVGTGYVGLVTGVVLTKLGHQVQCVDRDERKCRMLALGKPTIYEPGIEELLCEGLRSDRLEFTDDLAKATRASDIVFVAVGTPPGPDGEPDLSFLHEALREIAAAIDAPKVLVIKSTVPVGTGDAVRKALSELGVPDGQVEVVNNPEFLREGSAIHDSLHPDRIVVGARDRAAAERVVGLFAKTGAPALITDSRSAEMVKYASNCFLAAKISFVNGLSRLCELSGADIDAVAEGMGMDPRIGPQFLKSGLGWGGSCFPKDVQGLLHVSQELGYDFRLLQEVWNLNEEQTDRFVDRMRERLGGFDGKRVAVLGIAFKPNTDDIRGAKALQIMASVVEEGGAVCAYDPVARENAVAEFPNADYAGDPYDAAEGADAVVLATEWPELVQLDLKRLARRVAQPILFDGRRALDPECAQVAGFDYFAVGSRRN
jgi:UDPglucose 6-dehydrogenase